MGCVNFMFSKRLENTYLRAALHIFWEHHVMFQWSWTACVISSGLLSWHPRHSVDCFWFKMDYIWKLYEVGSLRKNCLKKIMRIKMDYENKRTEKPILHMCAWACVCVCIHAHIHTHTRATLVHRKLKFLLHEDYCSAHFRMWNKRLIV